MKSLALAGFAALALAGCSTTATVSTGTGGTPAASVSAAVSTAVTAGYDELCVSTASNPSLLSLAQTVPLNAQRQADIASLQAMCNAGAPTNAVTVLVDGMSAYALLKRDFPSLGLK
jgi:hypothetical protein